MTAGALLYTQMSVMQVPRLIAPGLTFGAALSNSTHDRPCASLPVTTRRIGFSSSDIAIPCIPSGVPNPAQAENASELPNRDTSRKAIRVAPALSSGIGALSCGASQRAPTPRHHQGEDA